MSDNNSLISSIERSMFTFNLNNINDICFNKISLLKKEGKVKSNDFDDEKVKVLVDNCVDKYFQTFKIVKEVSRYSIEQM